MTDDVAVNDRSVRWEATAGQKIFDIDFPIDSAEQVAVYTNGVLEDPENYAVSVADLSIEFTDGREDGDIVTVEGLDPVDRPQAYQVRGGLQSGRMNEEARNIYRQLQELRRDVGRCLSLNKAEAISAAAGLALLTANAVLAVNSTGDGFVMGPLTTDYASFANLVDVDFTSTANNDAVFYDSGAGKWVNKNGAAARSALGLGIGTNVQAYDAELAAFAGLTSSADTIGYFTGAGTMTTTAFTSTARSLLDDTSTSAMRTTLGLAIGTDVQAYDAELAAFAGLASAADKIGYFTGAGTMTTTDFTSTARSLLDDTSTSAMRTTLGLVIGTDVQAYDAELAALAGLVSAANKFPMFSGSGTATLIDFKDEDNMASNSATAVPSQQSVKAYIDAQIIGSGSGDVVAANYGTEYSANYALLRSNIGLAIGTNVQAYDAELAAFAGLTSAADKIGYFTGAGTMTTTDFTSTARSLLDDTSTSAMRTTLGLAIGTNVQAYDAELAAFAGLTSAADTIGYFTGSGTMTTTAFTSTARNLLDDTSTGAMRTTLGLGSAATYDEMTAAQYWANTADKIVTTDTAWAANASVGLTDAATIAMDLSTGLNFSVTLTTSRVLGNPSNVKDNQSGQIRITQPAGGGAALTYGANWKGTGGISLSTAGNAVDLLFYTISGTTPVITGIMKGI
ncbi:MAG: hypothetical protein JNM12_10115 [Alphaproteobacteria bacterium]|nr:hypothetical protein [Alphaproteobacteria bacterium]